jgi:DNA-binding NtrC family response regulator
MQTLTAPTGHLNRSLIEALNALLEQIRAQASAARVALFLRLGRGRRPSPVQLLEAGEAGPTPDAEEVLALPVLLKGEPVGVLELFGGVMEEPDARLLPEQIARLLSCGEPAVAARIDGFGEMVGESAPMRWTFDAARRVARTDKSVLVTGKVGTGKALLAQTLHAHSKRAGGPLVRVNCDGESESVVESRLFGGRTVEGRLALAHGGTLYLSDIEALSLVAQVRLVRVFKERRLPPVGGRRARSVDLRLVASTSGDLEGLVRAGLFRPDLFEIVRETSLQLPTLRERGRQDLLQLIEHFARVHGQRCGRVVNHVPRETVALLRAESWPGNLRDLSCAVEAAVANSTDGVLWPELFSREDG